MGGWNKSFWGAGEPSKAHKCVERQEVSVCLSIRKAREMHRLLLGVTEGKLKASNGSPGGFKVCGYLQGQVNQSVLRNPAHSRAGLCWYLGLGKILHTDGSTCGTHGRGPVTLLLFLLSLVATCEWHNVIISQ